MTKPCYRNRSGALHAMTREGVKVVIPKLSTVTHLGMVEDPTKLDFERLKGQNLHAFSFNEQEVFLYTPVMKVFPDKENDQVWFDNYWNVTFETVKQA